MCLTLYLSVHTSSLVNVHHFSDSRSLDFVILSILDPPTGSSDLSCVMESLWNSRVGLFMYPNIDFGVGHLRALDLDLDLDGRRASGPAGFPLSRLPG